MNIQKKAGIAAVVFLTAFFSFIIRAHKADVLWEQYKKENSCTKEISEDMRSIWYCANDTVFVRD